jgi:hypothetical protein
MDLWSTSSDVAGSPDPAESSSVADLGRARGRYGAGRDSLLRHIQSYALQYPVLYSFDLLHEDWPQRIHAQAAMLASASDEEVSDLTAERIGEILENIETSQGNIDSEDLKIWHLPEVTQMTLADLGIIDNPLLLSALDTHFRQSDRREAMIDIFLSAVAITAGILAALPTAGGSLAFVLSVGAGSALFFEGLARARQEESAGNVALDPAVADISVNDPHLFWVLIDLVAFGFDIAAAVRLFRVVRPAAAALTIHLHLRRRRQPTDRGGRRRRQRHRG